MTGRELYELWQRLQEEMNCCGSDGWDDLPPSEQEVWDRMATMVKPV
jgi:hypothetical protein